MPEIRFTLDELQCDALDQVAEYWVRTREEQAKMLLLTALGLRPAQEPPKLSARTVTTLKTGRVKATNGVPAAHGGTPEA